MDISIDAKVICSDGLFGRTTQLIIRPTSEEITHLVVSNESFPQVQYLVPIVQIAESTPEEIRLNCSIQELSTLPVFDKIEFIPSSFAGSAGGPYMMWPYFFPAATYITLENEQIPADELAIRRGASVEALDGHVGRVDEFLINPLNDHITHLVMREGHFWGQKDVTIPMSQIERFEENAVYLKLNKEDIEKLPAIPVQHDRATSDKTSV